MPTSACDSALIIADVAATLAAGLGAALGLKALLDPDWAGRLVRLQPDPARREGRAELRAMYGGGFLAVNGFAGAALWLAPSAGAWAAAAAGALWLGLGVVRLAFLRADAAATRYNIVGAAFELAMAAALFAPAVGRPLACGAAA